MPIGPERKHGMPWNIRLLKIMTHAVHIWSHQLHVRVSRTFFAPFNVCAKLREEQKKKRRGNKQRKVCWGRRNKEMPTDVSGGPAEDFQTSLWQHKVALTHELVLRCMINNLHMPLRTGSLTHTLPDPHLCNMRTHIYSRRRTYNHI